MYDENFGSDEEMAIDIDNFAEDLDHLLYTSPEEVRLTKFYFKMMHIFTKSICISMLENGAQWLFIAVTNHDYLFI